MLVFWGVINKNFFNSHEKSQIEICLNDTFYCKWHTRVRNTWGKKSVKLKFSHVPIAHLATFRLSRIIKTHPTLCSICAASKKHPRDSEVSKKYGEKPQAVEKMFVRYHSSLWLRPTLSTTIPRLGFPHPASSCPEAFNCISLRSNVPDSEIPNGREGGKFLDGRKIKRKRGGKSEVLVIWKNPWGISFSVFWANTP